MTIEQTQKPQMTQELIQAIQILQFNNQELTEYIANELLENPVLEPLKDDTSEETVDIDELRERLLEINSEAQHSNYSEGWDGDREEFSFERFVAFRYSLVEHLLSQLEFSGLNEKESQIGRYIVQCIDDNGYLTAKTEEIAESLGVEPETVESVISVIQTFDPVGVGARNLEECLAIQLKHKGETDKNVFEIVKSRLADIGDNKIALIAKDMGLGVTEVQTGYGNKGRVYDKERAICGMLADSIL